MRPVVTVILILSAILLHSCGGFYMIKKDEKPKIVADADKATLVIFRGTAFGAGVKIDNFIDEKFVGQTKGKSYFITKVDSGVHYIIGASENNCCAKIDFEAGKVYYLLQAIYPGIMFARTGFVGSNPEGFEKDVEDLSYFECCVEGEDLPTIEKDAYEQTIKDHERELKEDPERHKDTAIIKGY